MAGLEPVQGAQFLLIGRHRVFGFEQDRDFDQIAWGGLWLMERDGLLAAGARPRTAALHLLHLMRHGLTEYRQPLRGLREIYRFGNDHGIASVLLGETKGEATRNLWANTPRTAGYDMRAFRRCLGKHLTKFPANEVGGPLPIGVTATFRLAQWYESRASAVEDIVERLAAKITKWHAGKRRPNIDKWLLETRSNFRKAGLTTERDNFVWAVAVATWIAHSEWYPYALYYFAKRIEPSLNPAEAAMFKWYHLSLELFGVPLQCLRREYWDLVQPAVLDLLSRRTTHLEAKKGIGNALRLHQLLAEETRYEDNLRQKERKESESRKRYGESFVA